MHRLIKLRVIRDRERLEERMRRWMESLFEIEQAPPCFQPAADFFETPDALVLRMEVPGADAQDLSLTLTGRELVIRGFRRSSGFAGPTRFFHHELRSGAFERTFFLPMPIDPSGVTAQYLDGILEVRLPRQASRRIPVKETPEGE
jgi:HSP20 family protein